MTEMSASPVRFLGLRRTLQVCFGTTLRPSQLSCGPRFVGLVDEILGCYDLLPFLNSFDLRGVISLSSISGRFSVWHMSDLNPQRSLNLPSCLRGSSPTPRVPNEATKGSVKNLPVSSLSATRTPGILSGDFEKVQGTKGYCQLQKDTYLGWCSSQLFFPRLPFFIPSGLPLVSPSSPILPTTLLLEPQFQAFSHFLLVQPKQIFCSTTSALQG